jgi:hypothetical protein
MHVFSLVGWVHNFIGRLAVSLGLLTFAVVPASAFTMTFDEMGGCQVTGGTCSGVLAPAPSTGLVSGNVLTFTLPSLVFTGEAVIFEPNGTTVSDVLQWYCSTGPGTCGTLTDTAGNTHFASNRMIFYSLDSNGALADVGALTISGTFPSATENANGAFSFQVPNGVNVYDGISDVPLPAALPLFATGLGALGLLGWRRKRKAQATA